MTNGPSYWRGKFSLDFPLLACNALEILGEEVALAFRDIAQHWAPAAPLPGASLGLLLLLLLLLLLWLPWLLLLLQGWLLGWLLPGLRGF